MFLSIRGASAIHFNYTSIPIDHNIVNSIADVTEEKFEVSLADLPGIISGQKILKSCKAYSFIVFQIKEPNSDREILRKETNRIFILYSLKIIFPFHFFL